VTEYGTLPFEAFTRNLAAIFAEVDHITAADGPGTISQTHKTHRLAAVRTQHGEVVAEVLKTSLGPTVVYRSDTGELNPEDDSYRPWRQDRRWVIEPLTGDPDQIFDIMTRSGECYLIKGKDFTTRTFSFAGHGQRLTFE
jgi:hypothetical protein